jgi:hypothetical protein
MMVIASRSSTPARVSRNVRNAAGRWVLITASTARAKAMSVAVGMAQPARARCWCERDIDQGGHGHASDGGGHGQRSPARIAQVPGHELPIELQLGDEEEDREQAVGGGLAHRQVQVQCCRADAQAVQRAVGLAPR